MEPEKEIYFNGIKYSLISRGRYYLSSYSNEQDRQTKAKSLHVAILEFHNKTTVPKGSVVHHIDGNHFNNAVDNLEIMTIGDHARHHALLKTDEQKRKNKELMDRIRPLTVSWHKSEEGKAWHKEHARIVGEKLRKDKIKIPCKFCGKDFEIVYKGKKFCSRFCSNEYQKNKRHVGF